MRVLPIKDLKDLSFFSSGGYYRHAGPNGPEEVFFSITFPGGTRATKHCYPPAAIILLIVIILQILLISGARVRSRGTGPRATGPEGFRLSMRHSGSGDPELQSYFANRDNLVNPAPDS